MRSSTHINIPAQQASLSATLCLPDQSGVFPVVLMVHGSGALDRDENAKGFRLNIFNIFAESLAKKGIASLRYDKRGIAKSTGNYHRAGHFDLVDDAMCCLTYLQQHPQCDNQVLFLLGHSEGSIIVPQMAQKQYDVAGIILLTPFIDDIESVLLMQAMGLKRSADELCGLRGILTRFIFKVVDPVKTQKKWVKKIKHHPKDVVFTLFRRIPAKWLRELMSLSPPDIYQNTLCDCLIIGAEKDAQCHPDDVAAIASMMPGDIEAHVIKNMSHLLRREEGKPSILNYRKQLRLPIEEKVLRLINNWLLNKTAKR